MMMGSLYAMCHEGWFVHVTHPALSQHHRLRRLDELLHRTPQLLHKRLDPTNPSIQYPRHVHRLLDGAAERRVVIVMLRLLLGKWQQLALQEALDDINRVRHDTPLVALSNLHRLIFKSVAHVAHNLPPLSNHLLDRQRVQVDTQSRLDHEHRALHACPNHFHAGEWSEDALCSSKNAGRDG